jgi:hypothetical protein
MKGDLMNNSHRAIGSIGTAARVLVAAAVLYLALVDGPPFANGLHWGLKWYDATLGLVGLPALVIGLGLVARRAGGPVRFTGPLGVTVNLALILALVSNRYTGGGAALFYGLSMLVAAWRGQAGCESTVTSNWLLGRDDQIGCPTFTPLDELEARLRRRPEATPAR